MIEIRARSPQDGWAFVEQEGRTFLLYPPYQTSRPVADPRVIERALTTHGFVVDGRTFPDMAAVVKSLADEYVEAVAQRRSQAAAFDVIRDAPAQTLREIVARVIESFIPAGDLDGAERLIADILASSAARADDELHARAVEALRRINAARQQGQVRAADLLDMPALIRELAPLASQRYTAEAIERLANEVRERGLWSMAA